MICCGAGSHLVNVATHAFAIAIHNNIRKHRHLLLRLGVFQQQHWIIKLEIHFVLIENVKRHQVVSFETQVLKRFFQPFRFVIEV